MHLEEDEDDDIDSLTSKIGAMTIKKKSSVLLDENRRKQLLDDEDESDDINFGSFGASKQHRKQQQQPRKGPYESSDDYNSDEFADFNSGSILSSDANVFELVGREPSVKELLEGSVKLRVLVTLVRR
jgi:hypothetical protein